MNKRIKVIVVIFYVCAFYGCVKPYSNNIDLDEVNSIFQKSIGLLDQYSGQNEAKAYVIIPNVGCNGCISQAEQLLKDELDNPHNLKFILTNVGSMKLIKIKLGIDVGKYQNIIVDENNLLFRDGLNSIYPIILLVNDVGEVFKALEVSPFEDGIAALHEYLYGE